MDVGNPFEIVIFYIFKNNFSEKEEIMRRITVFIAILAIGCMFCGTLSAGIVGDINNDGKIDLGEAIYALQVAAGLYPNLDHSCLLVGKGSWATGASYNQCDVVEHNGSHYSCKWLL